MEQAPGIFLPTLKSPKSDAFPVAAIVTKSIVPELPESPPQTPRTELEQADDP